MDYDFLVGFFAITWFDEVIESDDIDWCSLFWVTSDEEVTEVLVDVYETGSVPNLGYEPGYGDVFAESVIALSYQRC